MRIPVIHGYIDRRILINFTADPEVIKGIVPFPFRPRIYEGKAIVGICLIRLKRIKPKGLPDMLGINSENGAHRIAVEWDEEEGVKSGVYIPRRDTSLRLNAWVGGRLFPGRHHLAKFDVEEKFGRYKIDIKSSDNTEIAIDAVEADSFNDASIFRTLENASDFFEGGELGYSPNGSKFDGLRLKAYKWEVRPMKVLNVRSGFFQNPEIFPPGSVTFDNALLMTNIEHEWRGEGVKATFDRM